MYTWDLNLSNVAKKDFLTETAFSNDLDVIHKLRFCQAMERGSKSNVNVIRKAYVVNFTTNGGGGTKMHKILST